jgi:phenylpyruvate tautomerase PptA (4-oxalocrotonate tautomerase family)
MPILHVEIVGALEPGRRERLAARIAEAAGAELGSRPGGTWVVVRDVPDADYAESGGGAPEDVRPVLVSVLKSALRREAERADEAVRLARAIGAECGRPAANVHVLYEPPAAGRIAFGGRLLRSGGDPAALS